ncbi:MAG: hypothetical protein ACT4PQ_08055 [Betaproteobacteria bacterium]
MKQFEPKFMKVCVLTAALQELTPRKIRDKDPDRAIEEWLQFAREVGADNIELSAALHPSESDVPADAMLDPVANTLDLRQPFDKQRAQRVFTAMRATGVGLSDLGYFDNMLHDDPAVRKKKLDFMMRVFDAALQHEVLKAQGIPIQGRGRQAYSTSCPACLLADNHTAPGVQHGQEEIERRDDRVRLHGSRPLQRLAAGGALHAGCPL